MLLFRDGWRTGDEVLCDFPSWRITLQLASHPWPAIQSLGLAEEEEQRPVLPAEGEEPWN
jgi:hypothetical protein